MANRAEVRLLADRYSFYFSPLDDFFVQLWISTMTKHDFAVIYCRCQLGRVSIGKSLRKARGIHDACLVGMYQVGARKGCRPLILFLS